MTNLTVKPLTEDYVPHVVDYWVDNSDENLEIIGADRANIPSRSIFINQLTTLCNTPISQANTFYMAWFIDGKFVGYNALKDIAKNDIAHMHLHMCKAEFRGKGYGAKLFCMAALEFYRLFNLKMILCEPRAENPVPNKMLTKIGFKKWKTYMSTSSELALTCELNSYIIDPVIAKKYLQM